MDTNKKLMKNFDFNEPIQEDQIVSFEENEKLSLPSCYRDFLKLGNGGEGAIGEFGYANFWRLEEVAGLNRDYEVQTYLPGYLVIGSDGGGEAFAFKINSEPACYVQVPFVGLSQEDCIFMGSTFGELLTKLSSEQ